MSNERIRARDGNPPGKPPVSAPMFAIMTPENSAVVTLNDNGGVAPPETILTGRGPNYTHYAIAGYARRHGIPGTRVGYSVREATPADI